MFGSPLHESHSQTNIREASSRPSERARVEGKFLFRDNRKLFLRGVTYGTFRPDPDGALFPTPDVVKADFAQMVSAGVNSVRTYTAPPTWLLDLAHDAGLVLLLGLPWEQHVDFLADRRRMASIRRRVLAQAASCTRHPAVLGYAIGNEIPGPIVRWGGRARTQRFLRALRDDLKAYHPEGLVTYANYPTTEYLELPFLDFLCFNVYLEHLDRLDAYLARLQNLAGDRPLVLGELGLDSRRHGELAQARGVAAQVETAFGAGSAGIYLFAWTDEWHRGGNDVTDWDFGLTSRARQPKPAFAAVRKAFSEVPLRTTRTEPRISVVVCVYNGAATLRDTLEGIGRLRYANFETIVVDDGSTDATAEIASDYPVRLIRTENRGLSAARNTGIAAATGEIVAFIDGDAWPDPDWLAYLAHSFSSEGWIGVGGPNLPPPGDGLVAECVACAPGGPTHVLLTDRQAEHIPGCNMAFWRSALLEVGGFDRRLRVAGDDVDICWKLQERGWKLGFNPAAVVWHHHRNSVRTYWRQQRGYGRAEALLEAKWPEKYNPAGHVSWGGRVYQRGFSLLIGWSSRVYHGTWGNAPFQAVHHGIPGVLASLVRTPEWFLLVGVFFLLSLLGLTWSPLLLAIPIFMASGGALVAQAVAGASRARYPTPGERMRTKFLLTAVLHLMQPLARLVGRLSHGLTPWRLGRRASFALPNARRLSIWSEDWQSLTGRLQSIESALRRTGAMVRRGGAYDRWDLEVRGGLAGGVRLRSCAEEHGQGRQMLRFHVAPSVSRVVPVLTSVFVLLGVWAAADRALFAVIVLFGTAILLAIRTFLECGIAAGATTRAIVEAADAGANPEASRFESHAVSRRTVDRRDEPSVDPSPPPRESVASQASKPVVVKVSGGSS